MDEALAEQLAEQEKVFLKCLRKRAEREAKKKMEKDQTKLGTEDVFEGFCQAKPGEIALGMFFFWGVGYCVRLGKGGR